MFKYNNNTYNELDFTFLKIEMYEYRTRTLNVERLSANDVPDSKKLPTYSLIRLLGCVKTTEIVKN